MVDINDANKVIGVILSLIIVLAVVGIMSNTSVFSVNNTSDLGSIYNNVMTAGTTVASILVLVIVVPILMAVVGRTKNKD